MKVLHLVRKIGITEGEWPRVKIAWGLRFFYQVGFVVAWTIITALFVQHFGIEHFWSLFFIDAVLFAVGAIIASLFYTRVKTHIFLLLSVGFTLLCLMGGWFFRGFLSQEGIPFFVCILLAKDLFFAQLNVALYRQNEELFSPSEATRIMPVVESAITIGNLVGAGLTVILLSLWLPWQVLGLWAGALAALALLTISMPTLLHALPRFAEEELCHEKSLTYPLAEGLHALKKVRFLKHIALLLVLQAVVFTVVEFEFTKELHHEIQLHTQHVASDSAHIFTAKDLQASTFTDVKDSLVQVGHEMKETAEAIEHEAEEVVTQLSSRLIMHEQLAHDLGMFHLIFSALALLVQLILTPWVLGRFGVIRSLQGYFAVLFSGIAAVIFGSIGVNSLRAIQHGFHSVGESAYHLSFYSIFTHRRESIRLVLEGLIKPIGMMGAIALVLYLPHEWMYGVLLALTLLVIGLCVPMRKSFTRVSEHNLNTQQDVEARLHAIEVLSQKGHLHPTEVLQYQLVQKDLEPIIREKIISTLTKLNDPSVVGTYIRILNDKSESREIKIRVLDSLFHLDSLRAYWKSHVFEQHHTLQTLHKLFRTRHGHMKKLVVMNMFRHMPSGEVVPFFLETVQNADEKLLSICLRSTKMFNDPGIRYYLREYLHNKNPRIRGHAILALWDYEPEEEMREQIQKLLAEKKETSIVAGLYTIGEVQDYTQRKEVLAFLTHKSSEVRLHANIALAKLGDKDALPGLFALLFGDDTELARRTYCMLDRIDDEMREHIKQEIRFEVSHRVAEILKPRKVKQANDLHTLPKTILSQLKRWYRLAEKYDDLAVMEKF